MATIYRKPNTPVSFWDRLNIAIEKASDISRNIIIVGDLNEDLLDDRNNHLRDVLSLNSMKNLISTPTRRTPNSETLLDPIAVSDSVGVLEVGTLDVCNTISDHLATYIHSTFTYSLGSSYTRTVWSYKSGDYDKLNDLIRTKNWDFLTEEDIDTACAKFISTLIHFIKQCVPNKEVIIRPNDKPWYDSTIRSHTRKRDRAKKKALKSGSLTDWKSFKRLRNKVNNLKKHAKERFYNNIENTLIESHVNNPKLYWKLIKHFIKSNKNAEQIPPLKTTSQTGEEVYAFTDLEKANCLNDYFVSISTVDDSTATLPPFSCKTQNRLNYIHIEESEIVDVILTLNVNKASGDDQISHMVLKHTCESIKKPLSILFNRSLHECKFPSPWKFGLVMPLFKKCSPELPSNHRPVSLLSNVGKLMERVIFKHVYNFLHANDLIYKKQSGFLPGHSTVYQLLDIYHQICQSIDVKQHTCMIFCDISKAFDRVWHKGLLFKLRQNGISGDLLGIRLSIRKKTKCFHRILSFRA